MYPSATPFPVAQLARSPLVRLFDDSLRESKGKEIRNAMLFTYKNLSYSECVPIQNQTIASPSSVPKAR